MRITTHMQTLIEFGYVLRWLSDLRYSRCCHINVGDSRRGHGEKKNPIVFYSFTFYINVKFKSCCYLLVWFEVFASNYADWTTFRPWLQIIFVLQKQNSAWPKNNRHQPKHNKHRNQTQTISIYIYIWSSTLAWTTASNPCVYTYIHLI